MENHVKYNALLRYEWSWIRLLYKCSLCYLGTILLFLARYPKLILSYLSIPNDYLAFWSGVRVAFAGNNPYELGALLHVQRLVDVNLQNAHFFLSPPWLLSFMSPLLCLPFNLSKTVFVIVNMVALVISARVFADYADKADAIHGRGYLLAVCSCIPAVICILLGQLSVLVLMGIVGFLDGVKKRRYWQAGVSFFLLLLKPHICAIFVFGALYWMIRNRKFLIIIFSSGTLIVMAVLPTLFRPTIYREWLVANELAGRLEATSVVSYLWFNFGFGAPSPKAMIGLLPITILCGVTVVWYFSKRDKNRGIVKAAPLMLVLSLIMTPYAWFYDYVLLLPVGILAELSGKKQSFISRKINGYYLYGANLMALAVLLLTPNLAGLFWYPFIYLLLLERIRRNSSTNLNIAGDLTAG